LISGQMLASRDSSYEERCCGFCNYSRDQFRRGKEHSLRDKLSLRGSQVERINTGLSRRGCSGRKIAANFRSPSVQFICYKSSASRHRVWVLENLPQMDLGARTRLTRLKSLRLNEVRCFRSSFTGASAVRYACCYGSAADFC